MAFAAVPDYLGNNFSAAPPGHRFYLYFQVWSLGRNGELTIASDNKPEAVDNVLKLNPSDQKAMHALAQRQQAIAGDHIWQLPVQTIAPLATGLGLEHPLENSFAFLNPYGLPYLPGSSIKGVLRQAARELADDEAGGWNQNLIDQLFGPETPDDDNAHRGALIFWDALPELPGNSLMAEVMTPHQANYYEGAEPPHDSGQPTPILFLALPPGTRLNFLVDCDRHLLASDMTDNDWQEPLYKAFEYACDWLGFGAKTAVGYGHLEIDTQELANRREAQAARQAQQKEAERIREATHNLPDDAAELAAKQIRGLWPKNNNSQIVPDLDAFLSPDRDSISQAAYDLIVEELEDRWPGITQDPEAIKITKQATKKKPAKTKALFSGKSKEIAIRLLHINIEDSS